MTEIYKIKEVMYKVTRTSPHTPFLIEEIGIRK